MAIIRRALELMNKDDWKGALRELDAYLATESYDAQALGHKVICLIRLDRFGEAEKAALQACSYSQGQTYNEASKLLSQLSDLSQPLFRHAAIKRMNAGDIVTAERILDEAVQRHPHDAELWFYRAICQAKSAKFDAAKISVSHAQRSLATPELQKAIKNLKQEISEEIASSKQTKSEAARKERGGLSRIGKFIRDLQERP